MTKWQKRLLAERQKGVHLGFEQCSLAAGWVLYEEQQNANGAANPADLPRFAARIQVAKRIHDSISKWRPNRRFDDWYFKKPRTK